MAGDLLKPRLDLVFCGYNPSLTSGRSGHHYAHPGNRFEELVEHYRALPLVLAGRWRTGL